MLEIVEFILAGIGFTFITIGAICDLVAAIGINRFPNFFVRLHAATIGIIGGAVIPLIGVSLVSLVSEQLGFYRFAVSGIALITALVIMIVAPTGTHILAYATHKARLAPVYPKVVDKLEEREVSRK